MDQQSQTASKRDFKIENLKDFDEPLVEEINQHIERAVRDMHERPLLDKDRTVTIKLSMRPNAEGRFLDTVDIRGTVDSKTPAATSMKRTAAAFARRPGALVFEMHDRNNPHQMSLEEEEERRAKEADGVLPIGKAANG